MEAEDNRKALHLGQSIVSERKISSHLAVRIVNTFVTTSITMRIPMCWSLWVPAGTRRALRSTPLSHTILVAILLTNFASWSSTTARKLSGSFIRIQAFHSCWWCLLALFTFIQFEPFDKSKQVSTHFEACGLNQLAGVDFKQAIEKSRNESNLVTTDPLEDIFNID